MSYELVQKEFYTERRHLPLARAFLTRNLAAQPHALHRISIRNREREILHYHAIVHSRLGARLGARALWWLWRLGWGVPGSRVSRGKNDADTGGSELLVVCIHGGDLFVLRNVSMSKKSLSVPSAIARSQQTELNVKS